MGNIPDQTSGNSEPRQKRGPRKIFTVLIRDNEYDVYDIEGKDHPGYNDTPTTWWLYHAERLPEGTLPPEDSDDWQAWDKGINRSLWDIQIKQRNSTKEKWGDTHFRNNTSVEMYCNKKLVYAFTTTGSASGLSYAFAKIQYLQTVLAEYPGYNFFNVEENRGRKIYWHGLPAFCSPKTSEPWCMGVIPDYSKIPKEQWWKEYRRRQTPMDKEWHDMDRDDDSEESDYINWGDVLEAKNVGWFRKDDDVIPE